MKPAITETHPQVAEQWHPTLNGDLRVGSVTSGSTKKAWWLGPCGHEWDAMVNVRTLQSQGCPYCTGKRLLAGYNDLATVAPQVASEWHPTKNGDITPNAVKAGSSDKVWWLGSCGHEWYAQIRQRVQKNSGCAICSNQLTVPGINDLATTHPALALLWDNEKNDKPATEVNAGSKKKAYWKCTNNHEFVRPIAEQSLKLNGYCFECSPKNIVPGINDFQTLHPDIAKEWHPTKNGDLKPSTVSPESHNKVWWVGSSCGHEFFAVIRNRAKKSTGCTICSNQQVLRGYNDLASLRPDFHLEWHPTKNGNLNPYEIVLGSSKRVWWLCSKGHEWEVRPADRVNYKTGCPACNASTYISKPEQAIADFIASKGFTVKQSDRSLLKGSGIGAKEIDIVIPEAKLAIEFNGLYYHTEIMGKDRTYHFRKWEAVTGLGYQLIQIWEDEWEKNPELIKNMILHKLGISDSVKIFARKTKVSSVNAKVAKAFLEANHIQGFAAASYYDGLFDASGNLIALLALKKEANNRLNIVRYATAVNVVGGFTKLLKYAERNYEVKSFVTFSDNCVSDGGLYENNGFVVDKQIPPDYKYLWRRERKHKFQYRLKRFKTDPALLWQDCLTERELASLNKLHRIWDAGKIRWIKTL
jgi:hypothetical protein